MWKEIIATRYQNFANRVTEILLDKPRRLVLLLASFVIIFEILEEVFEVLESNANAPFDLHFFREIVFFGFIFPLATGWLVNRLFTVLIDRDKILWEQELEGQLSQEMLSAPDKTELAKTILNFLRTMTPVQGVYLFSYSEEDDTLILKGSWWLFAKKLQPTLPISIPVDYCGIAMHTQKQGLHLMGPDRRLNDPKLHGYCLPLFQNERRIGIMHIYLPATENLGADQIRFLDHMAPAIALAQDTIALQIRVKAQSVALQEERQRIARQLHDSLGQNLAYLRMKLDQMSEESTEIELDLLHQNLERMRYIAYETYDQMRQTLIDLHPDGEKNLTEVLLAQLQAFNDHPSIQLQKYTHGEAKSLPYTTQRKIQAIFREAINNVLRHSHAKNVKFSVSWNLTDLTISLEDDGIGFDSEVSAAVGHFGLLIMQQRAAEIKANLKVITAPERGAVVILYYPL